MSRKKASFYGWTVNRDNIHRSSTVFALQEKKNKKVQGNFGDVRTSKCFRKKVAGNL